ncbi:hypothetical protein VIBNISOn1_30013 [Vibrio nigripulchritudo SOn1]|uniref:Uncharacterized protein n=1 Tax=Vibrio nigripulchritudo SOn1 TaxID=1238450 RepID=A0AAV2VSD3_9VIBR|nr:hypothetical protein [Vibrio nigripulchritudo]CCO47323.1 hypothetical protein VIBNISOn1_30013 [Vibrio nigripulchritudo SOn1]
MNKHQRLHHYADKMMSEQPVSGRCDYTILNPGKTKMLRLRVTYTPEVLEVPYFGKLNNLQPGESYEYDIYLGSSAVELLAHYHKQGNTAADGTIYAEVNEGDVLSNSLFILTVPGERLEHSMGMSGRLIHLLPIFVEMFDGKATTSLVTLLDLKNDGQDSENGEQSEESDFKLFIVESLESLSKILDGFSKDLVSDLHVPRELWHPKERPADFNQMVREAGETINNGMNSMLVAMESVISDIQSAIDYALKELESWVVGAMDAIINIFKGIVDTLDDAIEFAEGLVVSLTLLLKRFKAGFASFLAHAKSALLWMDKNRPDFNESIDTFIGFFGGVWDGIVDSILGFIDTLSLILQLIIGAFKHGGKLGDAFSLMLEVADDFIAVLRKIPWDNLWYLFTEELYPEVKTFFTETSDELMFAIGDAISRTPAASGYYFGYLVYNLVEMFFPPLKFSKISGAANEAADLTSKFFQKMAKMNG